LKQHWYDQGGIRAYKTVAMNEFPNMFYLLGPNSGSGDTSVLFVIEWRVLFRGKSGDTGELVELVELVTLVICVDIHCSSVNLVI
jgi:cation diffusion facilitator CzcD-associated flavoprotein CzcO